MNELSKLLTFMFKEDRDEILKHYNELLDNAEDEEALLESFGSPTKLAVTISRSYNREERKLEVSPDSKSGSSSDKPIVKPIANEVKAQVKKAETGAYADIIEEIRREAAEENGVQYKPLFPDEQAESVAPVDVKEDNPPIEEAVPAEAEAPAQEEATIEEKAPADDVKSINGVAVEEFSVEEPPSEPDNILDVLDALDPPKVETVIETNTVALVFYTIAAVIVGIAALAIIIAIGIAAACLGILGCSVGIELLSFAFSGIQIFADIMLVLGCAIVCLAIALLLMWLALWILIAGIEGLISGLKNLGYKLCTKEVTIDG